VISELLPEEAADSADLAAVAFVDPVPPLDTDKVPVTPVLKDNPVALVKVSADGVPRFGVVNTGDADRTTDPEPVEDVTPVPPFDTERVPSRVIVPDVVTGPPAKVSPVRPPLTLTEVTVPTPVTVFQVGVAPGPAEVRT
jgi:hypothetical protein